jgi:hypothetical protein
LAVPENTAESAPAEIPVICQVTVLEAPADKVPTFTEGELIEKCPLCEPKLAETLDNTLYAALLTLTELLIVAVTVAVCPTVRVDGIWLPVMLRVWLYP